VAPGSKGGHISVRSAVDTEDTADIGDIVDRSGMVDCKDMVDFDDIAHFAGIVDPDDSADSMDRNYYRRVGGEGNWVEHASEYGGGIGVRIGMGIMLRLGRIRRIIRLRIVWRMMRWRGIRRSWHSLIHSFVARGNGRISVT